MEYVYYTLVGLLALAGIVLVIVSLYKLVIFLGGKIDDWWDDRQRMKHREEIGLAPIQWSNDGGTGRVVTDKPKKPHKHMWRFKYALNGLEYRFVCECGETMAVPIDKFWGSPTIRSERALKRAELVYSTKKAYERELKKITNAYRDYPW